MKSPLKNTDRVLRYFTGNVTTLGLFKPYRYADTFSRDTISIVSAPLMAAGLLLRSAATLLDNLLVGITLLVARDGEAASEYFVEALSQLFNILQAALMIIVSPIINTVGLIGSGIATLMPEPATEETLTRESPAYQ